jgi:hypothetical protein
MIFSSAQTGLDPIFITDNLVSLDYGNGLSAPVGP